MSQSDQSIFVNFSNHLSDKWDERQRAEAEKYGTVVNIPFPNVPASYGEEEVSEMADEYTRQILSQGNVVAAMVQGEFTLSYAVITELKKEGIITLSACTERNVTEKRGEDGSIVKESKFEFVRYRHY